MTKIVILDSDVFSQKQLVSVLGAAGLMSHCRVEAMADEEASIHLCVGGSSGDDVHIWENDRFVRPFRVGALLERVRKHIADLTQHSFADVIVVGPYTLNMISGALSSSGGEEEIKLTEKEKYILALLARNSPDVTDRQSLLDEVWGYAETVETHTLETHIYRLRQKIETNPAEPQILVTEDNGYRLGN